MKKLLLAISIVGVLGFAAYAFSAPTTTFQRTILPEITDTYDSGTTTQRWLNVVGKTVSSTQVCLGGDCRSVWPAAAQSSSLFTSVSTTNLYSSGTSNLTNLTFGSATGTNLSIVNTSSFRATIGVSNITLGYFVGVTTNTYDGTMNGLGSGYDSANGQCSNNFSGSHICSYPEIASSIALQQANTRSTTAAFITNGPPGYTANAFDCDGYTSNDTTHLGAIWQFQLTKGGFGTLTNCGNTLKIACCK